MSRVHTLSLAIGAALLALVVGWMAGRATHEAPGTATSAEAPAAERKVLYYRNPMGLADTSPVPKKDPMGMDYVPVFADDAASTAPDTVVLAPEKVQALGVRTEAVRHEGLAATVRSSGTVEVDETRQYVVAPRFEGWVQRLYANQTGVRVRAGQPLLSVYSPQLAAAQQEFRLADETARRLAASDPTSAASMVRLRDAARTRLRNWEISDAQLGRSELVLTARADAVVIEKTVVQGARFAPGETILRLADLSTVWVIAKVPAAQAAGIKPGQPARFETVALPGQVARGEVAFVQPLIDAQTRTVDVRVALPNPDGDLRPGLYGTVWIEQPGSGPVLSIPRSAVLDSGTRQVVLVETGTGRFAPREVTLGRRGGDRVAVLDGLAHGERVVVSANFLIDAESNLQAALQGMQGHAGHGADPGRTEDPHAGHGDGTAAPHAGHGDASTDPHAGHAMPEHAPAPTAAGEHDAHGSHGDHEAMGEHDAHAPPTGHEGH